MFRLGDYLDQVDYFIIVFYFFTLLLVARFSLKRKESQSSYFLMSRRLTLPMFIATLVSTWYGGIFGVTEIAYREGIYSFFAMGVFWYLTYLIFALFIVPKLFHYRGAMTLPDLVEQSVGKKAAKITAIFNVVDVFPVAYVLAIGILVQALLPVSLPVAMLLGTLFVASYTAVGGLRSVVYTDCLQFIVMFLGVSSVVVFSMIGVASLSEMWQGLPASHKAPVGTESGFSFAVWGFIALATLIDPNFYTRCFAAVDLKTARNGVLYSTFFWIIFDLCTTFGALYAQFYMPGIEAKHAYLQYAMKILPVGFKGLLIASVASTILSTLDSYLFTASTIGLRNLLRIPRAKMVTWHRISVFLFSLAAVCMASQFTGGFKQIWKFFGSLNGGCLLFPVICSLFSKNKINEKVFCLAVSLSALTAIFWEFFLKNYFGSQLETFYVALFCNVVVLLIWGAFIKINGRLQETH